MKKPAKSLRNQGISTVQVLIGMGLAIGAFLILFQLFRVSQKQQSSVKESQELETLSQLAQSVLRNPWLCEKNLVGQTSHNLEMSLLQLLNVPRGSGPSTVFVDFDKPRGSFRKFKATLKLASLPTSTIPEPIRAQFNLEAARPSGGPGDGLIIRTQWPSSLVTSDFQIYAAKLADGSDPEFKITGCRESALPTPTPTPGTCTNPSSCGFDADPFCCPTYSCVWGDPGHTYTKCVPGCVQPPSCVSNSECCSGTVCSGGHCGLPPTPTPAACRFAGDSCAWTPLIGTVGTIPTHNCCSLTCALIDENDPTSWACRTAVGLGFGSSNESCGPSGGGRPCASGLHCEFTSGGAYQCIP